MSSEIAEPLTHGPKVSLTWMARGTSYSGVVHGCFYFADSPR
jgi:hypothetical protein